MTQARVRAVYMRGGTSRCLVFHERDLPPAGVERDRILLAALGSPDPYGRQLDGLGGGISSLSKACIIGPPTHPDADVDYTFAQVEVSKAVRGLHGQLRQLLLGRRALRHRRAARASPSTARRSCASTTPTRRRSSWRTCRWRAARPRCTGDFELPGVAGTRRAHRARLRRPGRRGHRPAPADRPDARDRRRASRPRWWTPPTPWSSSAPSDLGLTGTETPQAMDGDRALVRAPREDPRRRRARSWASRAAPPRPRWRWSRRPPAFTALDGTAYDARARSTWSRASSPWAIATAPSR